MTTKREEAQILAYRLLYDRSGKLITERIKTDIKDLKPYFKKQDYEVLKVILREAGQKMDEIHNHIEGCLNARVSTNH
jgi:hypothetical protein|tara:strand:- start:5594 stop:5827 length:234 start_codon:yes stop_codon:yes gene_type:complete